MNIYNNLSELPEFRNAVITIGSFDGLHKGHQMILRRLEQLAETYQGESIVITFHPHPRHFLYPENDGLKLLTTIDEKARLMEKYGVKNMVVVPFNKAFSEQSPEEYIEDFLIEKFHPRCVVIGYDHRFGKDRAGNIEIFRKYATKNGFEIVEIEQQEVDDITVSSTKIRRALEAGDIKTANYLQGHPYSLSGTVVHGKGFGKKLGYPTANLEINSKHKLIPRSGIYAVRASLNKKVHNALLYIGNRPSLPQFNNQTIEVHLLDFDKNIYGDKLSIDFVSLIRIDAQFENLDLLKAQMQKDEIAGRKILAETERKETPEEEKKKDLPSVAVVILNYNGEKLLRRFLPSVLNSEYFNLKIIIADNGSTDRSLDLIHSNFPETEIIQLPENHGFARGYNEALKQVEADYLVLLNSDVEVTQNWIKPVIEMMDADETIGACQPKILSFNDKSSFEYAGACGGMMDQLGYPFCRGRIFSTLEKDTGQYDDPQEVFWASGAAIFVRSKLFHQLGGFDEDYEAHQEEIDLCWRIKRAGYKIMVQPKSSVFHLGGGTMDYANPRKTYLNFRNTLYSLLKNERRSKLLWLIPLRLILDAPAAFLFLLEGKFSQIGSILKAHFSFYKNFHKFRRKRLIYNDLVAKSSISAGPNEKGIFKGSLIWQYYILRRKYFKNLPKT